MTYSDPNSRPQARAIALPADRAWSPRQTLAFLLVVNGTFWLAAGVALKLAI